MKKHRKGAKRAFPEIDAKAWRKLHDVTWGKNGWLDHMSSASTNSRCSPQDFAYAKAAGVMFDDVHRTHDEWVDELSSIVQEIDPVEVANAFVVSLRSRRVDVRSAFGSFVVHRKFPRHGFASKNKFACEICGEYDSPLSTDLSVLNFKRIKWSGVRHAHVQYACFDLSLFKQMHLPKPQAEDVMLLRNLLNAVRKASVDSNARRLAQTIVRLIPSNKAEAEKVVEFLGFAGILHVPNRASFAQCYVPSNARDIPGWSEVEYPACWWKGSYGVQEAAVKQWFGHLLKGA